MEALDHLDPESIKLTISEAEAVTGVARTHINRILDDGHFAEIWGIKRNDRRRVLNLDHCVFVRFYETAGRLLAPKARRDIWHKYVEKIAAHGGSHNVRLHVSAKTVKYLHLIVVLEDSLSVDMSQHYLDVFHGWEALSRSKTEIVTDPEVRCGIPVIGGTRIGAYEVAGVVEKVGLDEVLAIYPSLDAKKVEAAVMYAKAHPRIGRPSNAASRSIKAQLKSSNVVRRESI